MGDRVPRSWPGAAGAVALVAVLLVAAGFAVPYVRGLVDGEPVTRPGPAGWERLPRPPANDVLRGPDLGSAVWTGEELLLLAESPYSPPRLPGLPEGLAYDPDAGRWRALPEPPLRPEENGGGVPVWTGEELLLVSAAGTPLAYDPDGDAWRRFTPPPAGLVPEFGDPPVWTGAEVLVWSGADRDEATWRTIDGGQGAAYDPAADRWRRLPRSPLGYRTWSIQAWTGEVLLVVAGACGDEGRVRCEDGAAYDPATDRWTPIPPLAGGVLAPDAASAWTGSELVVWTATTGRDGRPTGNLARAYDPRARRWRTLPAAPIAPRRLAAVVWAGDRLLVWGGLRDHADGRLSYPDDGAAYDPASNRWQPLPRAPVPGRGVPLAVWAGDRAIFIGGFNAGDRPSTDRGNLVELTEQGAAYHPAGG